MTSQRLARAVFALLAGLALVFTTAGSCGEGGSANTDQSETVDEE